MDITDENVYLLLEAIVKQAADDYRKALRIESQHHNIIGLRDFFHSDFCEGTLGASGEYILEQLDKEFIEEVGDNGLLQQIREYEAKRNKAKYQRNE